ncbi:MAG: tripartite tricarboxylate transporter substrate binding protein [Rhodocyclaceae bacterium]|nr:tripartite tricarboxylate transporter substrate binding protein [Rhodocyclaceae bacterium]MCA3073081.1 tripartite tricarboxylate transporter substrate binding protein [Rhodocyclaceae bacterium]MCA3091500.1 tripartite tricarboxylate transporter substrate binding protein [Rhodocyclaceae bacterium]MCA3094022.1 tripartite tricarboxylate transporter substrate binding protein [Rhodocyclaceae bacterium]MCA3099187.1 tripartite tricarboxylate transporter substrate binding protein [Rhodocyclaceae bact
MNDTPGTPVRAALLLAAITFTAAVHAQPSAASYPAKPIRWIVPYPTGGTSDFLARLIGQKLTDAWGQPVLVDNRSGANGNIGTEVAARAAADGYTLLLVASTFTMNPAVYPKLPFDSARDFAPVTTLLWQPYALSVHPSVPATSVRQLLDLARAKPGDITYSSGGNGNATHIAAELFASMAKVQFTHVPYRGVGPAIQALLAGEVKLSWASSVAVRPHLASARLRVLAVTGTKRIAALPDVPTVSESGVPDYVEGNWQMVLVPARTPGPLIERLNTELVRILRTPELTASIQQTGSDVMANSPAESAALIRADLVRYGRLIRALDIRPE